MVAFDVATPELVDTLHAQALALGGTSEGDPGHYCQLDVDRDYRPRSINQRPVIVVNRYRNLAPAYLRVPVSQTRQSLPRSAFIRIASAVAAATSTRPTPIPRVRQPETFLISRSCMSL